MTQPLSYRGQQTMSMH